MASLDQLLQTTSRTFALAIPLLPEPEQTDVMLGYLVFRIADTLEDADNLSRDDRVAALGQFSATLDELTPAAAAAFTAEWAPRRPCDNDDYQRLMEQTGDVLAALAARPSEVREIVVRHTRRSIAGMQATLRRADAVGSLACETVDQLRDYCYYVAGIVGELLTDLFERRLGASVGEALRDNARWFGEGLQLVNILKDAADDAQAGRTYLPAAAPLEEVFAIAADDLACAARYIATLEAADAPAGYVAFTRGPRELAVATLGKLRTAGAGAKLTRPEVTAILGRIHAETFGRVGETPMVNEPVRGEA